MITERWGGRSFPYFMVLRAKIILLVARVQGIVVISPTYIKFDQFLNYLNLQRGDVRFFGRILLAQIRRFLSLRLEATNM